MKLDPNTFGDMPAAVNLAAMLSAQATDKECTHVANLLAQNNRVVNMLALMEDRTVRAHLLHLQRKYVMKIIYESGNIPEYAVSHVANVAAGKIKQLIRDTTEEEREEQSDADRFRAWLRTSEDEATLDVFRKIQYSDQFTMENAYADFVKRKEKS